MMGMFADEFDIFDVCNRFMKPKNGSRLVLDYINSINFVKKIIFNDPCVILIDNFGNKEIVRTHGKDQYDMMFGYYLVLCKYLSDNDTYSDLLEHIYEVRSMSKRIDLMEVFLLAKLGAKCCRKIDFYMNFSFEELTDIDVKKNYTINFQEVLND